MARTLSSGNNLSHAAAVLTAVPFTMACWFKVSSVTGINNSLMSLDDNSAAGAGTHTFLMDITQSPTARVRARTASSAGSSFALSTANVTTGVWQHACGVFAGVADRRAFLNGANKGTETTSRTPSAAAIIRTRIGLLCQSANPMAGDIAEAAIWNVALSDAEVALLATGVGPYAVQRANLVAYWPLLGAESPEPDVVGTFAMSLVGSPPQAAHPFVFYGKDRLHRRGLAA